MIINVKDIKKSYTVGTQEVNALRGINLSVEKGEFISQLWGRLVQEKQH